MKHLAVFALLAIIGLGPVRADAPDAQILTGMLDEFLAGASVNDLETHRRFWADDLIYTSSTGERFGKADILERNAPSEGPDQAEGPGPVYSAEDVKVRQYDDTAVVAFRLVARTGEPARTMNYFNTGTFIKRDGRWQAVAWQATRIPEPE